MQEKNSKLGFVLLLTLALLQSSCARVQIKDHEFCGDMGELGASCFHTLTTETRDLTFEQWRIQRFGMLCTDAQSFADWKAALLKLCSYTKRCDYQTQLLLDNFFLNLDRIGEKTNEVR